MKERWLRGVVRRYVCILVLCLREGDIEGFGGLKQRAGWFCTGSEADYRRLMRKRRSVWMLRLSRREMSGFAGSFGQGFGGKFA